MKVNIVKSPTESDWIQMRSNALFTQRKDSVKPVSSILKTKFLASEHSPIYTIHWTVDFIDIPYWVSNQIVRSHEGFVPFVSSQRNDIQKKYDRRKAPQDAFVNLRFQGNAQAIMTISRKRTCFTASAETRNLWNLFLNELAIDCPELHALCVKPCVYRHGICPELFSKCRYNTSEPFKEELSNYEKMFKLP